jgi:hypothetical protein
VVSLEEVGTVRGIKGEERKGRRINEVRNEEKRRKIRGEK